MDRTGAGAGATGGGDAATAGVELELSVRLAEPRWRSGTRGLLLPLPPSTPHQRLVGLELPPTWRSELLRAEGRAQKAVLVTEATDLAQPWRMRFRLGRWAPDPAWYRPYVNSFTALPAALRPIVNDLRAATRSETELVARAAAWVSTRFRYDPTPSSGAFPDVACDIRSGSCLDVNTVFLSVLYAAEIQASYDIGYWFDGDARTCDGWHCWVSVIADGVHQDWDVPHHLKFDVGPPRPALDPKPGLRFCMSRGRGNRFEVGGAEVEISHFGRPRWVLAEGETVEPAIAAQWSPSNGPERIEQARGAAHAELG